MMTTTKARAKKVTPLYENKAEVTTFDGNFLIEVVRAHDGLNVGERYRKPIDIATKMETLGFWKIING